MSGGGARTGVVAIGRNEGERLKMCLASLRGTVSPLVYVDSGSTDGSVQYAKDQGCDVVELDRSTPFTMARARNTGFHRLMEIAPETESVQFVDGDCEIEDGWIEDAVRTMASRQDVGAICGHRREGFREASMFNRLIDMDWAGPVGEVDLCGGDVLMRVDAFRQVKGYRDQMIAGEDPEICVRLRQCGWKLMRLDRMMTVHDADMTRLSQWWRRSLRTGHSFAEQAALHGKPPYRHCVRETRSNWFGGLILPLIVLALAWPTGGWSLLLLLAYPIWIVRIAGGQIRRGHDRKDAWLYAVFCTLGKFPQMTGQLWYWMNRLRSRRTALIEYK